MYLVGRKRKSCSVMLAVVIEAWNDVFEFFTGSESIRTHLL